LASSLSFHRVFPAGVLSPFRPRVAFFLLFLVAWLLEAHREEASMVDVVVDNVLALRREYADYKDRMERIPCSSRYPLSFVHKFTYTVPLPDYDAVRVLHRTGAIGGQRAKELCASGDVWLGYATAYFAVPPPTANGLLAAAIQDAQRAVNVLHDKFHLHRWPPRIDSIHDTQTAEVLRLQRRAC
jgi:hypothetical protein